MEVERRVWWSVWSAECGGVRGVVFGFLVWEVMEMMEMEGMMEMEVMMQMQMMYVDVDDNDDVCR